MILAGGDQRTWSKTYLSIISYTTNLTWTALGVSQDLNNKPSTNSLCNGMVTDSHSFARY
jgi:hypothetical protein